MTHLTPEERASTIAKMFFDSNYTAADEEDELERIAKAQTAELFKRQMINTIQAAIDAERASCATLARAGAAMWRKLNEAGKHDVALAIAKAIEGRSAAAKGKPK